MKYIIISLLLLLLAGCNTTINGNFNGDLIENENASLNRTEVMDDLEEVLENITKEEPLFNSSNNDSTGYGLLIYDMPIKCYGIEWNMQSTLNDTNVTCRCTKKFYNLSYCDEFTYMEYCFDDWDIYLSDDYFKEQIYPYLDYDCDTGELLTSTTGSENK